MIGGMTFAADRLSRHRQPFSRTARAGRWLRLRLAIPLLRLRHAPEPAARATMIGLGIAFTPTFGLRMPLVLLIWLFARHVLRQDFNLLLAIAWTWTTNALVTLPLYAGFFITGRFLTGQWHDLSGIDAFAALRAADQPMLAKVQVLAVDWGATLWLGALPWACLMATLGYLGCHRLLRLKSRGTRP